MKIRITLSTVLLFIFCSLEAQQWTIAKNFSYGSQSYGSGIGADKLGNVYTVSNSVLWKFDGYGNILWQNVLGSCGDRLVTDSSGFTYVTGANAVTLYNSSGQITWSTPASPASANYYNIALNPLGGVVAAGRVLIGNDTKTVLTRFDMNGNITWSRTGDFPAGGGIPYSVSCDGSGNTYWGVQNSINDSIFSVLAKVDNAGNLISTTAIQYTPVDVAVSSDNSINVLSTISNQSFYFTKYDQLGTVLWNKTISGTLGNNAIGADNNGNAYLAISYSSFHIDNISLTGPGVIVMKFDNVGNIVWFKNSTRASSTGSVYPGDICINSKNEVFITGAISGTHAFDAITLTSQSTPPDLLIAQISEPNGTTGLLIMPKETEIKGFPNPTGKIINIRISTPFRSRNYLLTMINSLGKTVYSEELKDVAGVYTKQIDLSSFASGVYFVDLLYGDKHSLLRIELR